MPRIKVCGVTDAAFAVEAARRGVDYLGLIFAEGSPRQVTPEKAHEIVAHVRADVGTSAVKSTPRFVGVFVRHTPAEIVDVATRVGLDAIQLHGDYDDSAVTTLKKRGYEVWRLFNAVGRSAGVDCAKGHDSPRGRLRRKPQQHEVAHRLLAGLDLLHEESLEDAVLLDGRRGNESRRADWSLVAPLKESGRRVVLAGGISAENISSAIATGADVIDVNSSIETSPGVKSLELLDELLRSINFYGVPSNSNVNKQNSY